MPIGCYGLSLEQTWKINHVGAENVMDLQLNHTTNEEKKWDEKLSSCLIRISAAQKYLNKSQHPLLAFMEHI